ncbi:hypothetical protein AVEN_228279-1 [Araneus ventricosus]|uniref:Uncharacterized protein n=1 Tax=Araneus ventricosus TaxID=182803 RepID=A0A4Y2ED91_ARAVE|nr:hypothetical protein AVEN_228279-1 [Araneus ventricosus]
MDGQAVFRFVYGLNASGGSATTPTYAAPRKRQDHITKCPAPRHAGQRYGKAQHRQRNATMRQMVITLIAGCPREPVRSTPYRHNRETQTGTPTTP